MRFSSLVVASLTLVGCSDPETVSDAFGNFEAVEVQVAAEIGGRLLAFHPREGDRLEAGAVVGQVDTTQLVLARSQIVSQRRAAAARLPGITAEAEVLRAQLAVLQREASRVQGLLEDGAATTKQRDDVEGQMSVLGQQILAVETRRGPVAAELRVLDDQLALMDDQLRRTRITNPIQGSVLATYAEPQELTAAGKPLYRVASLDTLELRAYVSGNQLPRLAMGDVVAVVVDDGNGGTRSIDGQVSWIAAEAEFTPKIIQTREERVDLVYAFKVRVPNPDGLLKIGMPGEVVFDSRTD